MRAVRSGQLAAAGARVAEGGLNPSQGAVLRIILENPFYPITLEMLHQVIKIGIVKICSNIAAFLRVPIDL